MKALLIVLGLIVLFSTLWIIPWWLIAAVLAVGGTWLWAWDRVETRQNSRIEPTESRRR